MAKARMLTGDILDLCSVKEWSCRGAGVNWSGTSGAEGSVRRSTLAVSRIA